MDLALIDAHDGQIGPLELYLTRTAKVDDTQVFARLQLIPGVGKVLALVLLYEIHDIRRFPEEGRFLSRGWCVASTNRQARSRAREATTPWPSSNWWIKTGRIEDNEVEATMAVRLKSMPTSPLSVVLQHLRADLGPDGDGVTDGELLARFVRNRDEDALAALVRRHASMVWGVCRRLLNHQDAEDAFQATFLVLVRKAADVPGHAVANWLYGVARQTAVRLQATAAKRGQRETQVVNMPEPTVPEVRDANLQAVVDEELSRLPDHYRGVVVLCDLEGMTRKEAARQLGIPEGSVASRLARARAMLAKRLTRRGVVFSGGSVAAVLSAGSASASAPPALVASTIKAASLLAAGQAAGVVTAKVAALTEGTVKAMSMTRIKSVLAVVLVVGLALGGIGLGGGGSGGNAQGGSGEEGKPGPARRHGEG